MDKNWEILNTTNLSKLEISRLTYKQYTEYYKLSKLTNFLISSKLKNI